MFWKKPQEATLDQIMEIRAQIKKLCAKQNVNALQYASVLVTMLCELHVKMGVPRELIQNAVAHGLDEVERLNASLSTCQNCASKTSKTSDTADTAGA